MSLVWFSADAPRGTQSPVQSTSDIQCSHLLKTTYTLDASPAHCASKSPRRHPPKTKHGKTTFQYSRAPAPTPNGLVFSEAGAVS